MRAINWDDQSPKNVEVSLMQLLKVGVAALNQTPLDWDGNFNRIIQAIQLAKMEQVQMLGLPELTITGYGCEDAFFFPDTSDRSLQYLINLLPYSQNIILNVGLPVRFRGSLFNCSAVLADGHLIGINAKKNLAGDGVHYEQRWFNEWPPGRMEHLDVIIQKKSHPIPFGDLFFEWKNIRFGYEICEEAWIAFRPGARLAEESIDIIFNPSASHFSFGKNEIRKRFVLEGSRAFTCVYAYANLLGNESGRIIFDGSCFIASQGEMRMESPRFSYQDVQMNACLVDLDLNRNQRMQLANFKKNRKSNEEQNLPKCIKLTAPLFEIPNQDLINMHQPNSQPILDKNQEFEFAVSLGLFDYLRKSRSQGFAISLSGGIDSSVVAILCTSAFNLAIQELGIEGLKQKLNGIATIPSAKNLNDILSQLIHCVYQKTENSSDVTLVAASELSKALGVAFSEWSIDSIKSIYVDTLSKTMGRPLSWSQDDLSLQNIQARVRAPGIWLLANLKNFLLLATSNRSEAAVGYATMDGDTAGGLSPLAGVDKAFLEKWVRWKAATSTSKLKSIPELKKVFQNPPTAELRPKNLSQTDEKDLMPYPLLDFIERHLLVDRLKPLDIYVLLKKEFPTYPSEELRNWLIRFLKAWTQNQWKRERLAPGFHLDSESLDPKTWCRFPILSKAFEKDIEELLKL